MDGRTDVGMMFASESSRQTAMPGHGWPAPEGDDVRSAGRSRSGYLCGDPLSRARLLLPDRAGATARRRGQGGAPAAKRGRTTLTPPAIGACSAARTNDSVVSDVARHQSPHHLPQVVRVGRLGLPRHVSADHFGAHGVVRPPARWAQALTRPAPPGGVGSCRYTSRTRPLGRASR